jgi:hypothetical protein
MKKHVILLALIFSGIHAMSQDYFHLSADTLSVTTDAMSTSAMTERLKKDAEHYARYAPIPRLAEMDISFGADLTEYKKLAGYGVLYIPSLNQDSSEYPIKRVYIRQGSEITELKKIGEINVGVDDNGIAATFGKHRIDYYYLIPYNLTLVYGELMVDWNTNRKEFVITKFPSQNTVEYDVKKTNFSNKDIDTLFLKAFLKREYSIGSN